MSKRRKSRRAYLDSFHQTPTGAYIYTGPTYSLQGSRRTAMARLIAAAAAAVICELAGGCLPAPGGSGCFYIVLPYVAALLACVSAAWAAARLAAGGAHVRAYVYEATVKKLPLRTALAAGFAGLTAAGEGFYLLRCGPQGRMGSAAAYLLCQLAAAAAMLALRRTAGTLNYRED